MSLSIPDRTLGAGQLLQHVSWTRHTATPLYFGRGAANRYDAPDRAYGVLYLGHELSTVLMESMFHKHRWAVVGQRAVSRTEVEQRLVRFVHLRTALRLADLSAPDVVASQFGLTLAQLVSRRYARLQRISQQIHAIGQPGRPRFDGICYPSRNNPAASCVALFDRAAAKVELALDLPLVEHKDWPDFVARFRIAVVEPPA